MSDPKQLSPDDIRRMLREDPAFKAALDLAQETDRERITSTVDDFAVKLFGTLSRALTHAAQHGNKDIVTGAGPAPDVGTQVDTDGKHTP